MNHYAQLSVIPIQTPAKTPDEQCQLIVYNIHKYVVKQNITNFRHPRQKNISFLHTKPTNGNNTINITTLLACFLRLLLLLSVFIIIIVSLSSIMYLVNTTQIKDIV